jgi:hypothetical protein
MSSAFYELVGRIVVRFAWQRYGRQIKIGGGAAALLLLAVGYLLVKRQPPEG